MTIKNYIMCVLVGSLAISLGAMENDVQKEDYWDGEKFCLIRHVLQANLPEKQLVQRIEQTAEAEEVEKLHCLVREINLGKASWEERKSFVEDKHQWIAELVSQPRNQDGSWKDRPTHQEIHKKYCDNCYKYSDKDLERWNETLGRKQFSQMKNALMMTDIFFLDTQKRQGLTEVLMTATVGASHRLSDLLRDYSVWNEWQKREFKTYDPKQFNLMNFSSAEFDRMDSVPANILLQRTHLRVNVQVTEDLLQQESRLEMAKGFMGFGGLLGGIMLLEGIYSGSNYDEIGKAAAVGPLFGAGMAGLILLADETQYRLGLKKFRPVYREQIISGEKAETKKKSMSRLASDLKNSFQLPRLQDMAFDSPNHKKLQRSILLSE